MKDTIAIELMIVRKDSEEGRRIEAEREKDRKWIDQKLAELHASEKLEEGWLTSPT